MQTMGQGQTQQVTLLGKGGALQTGILREQDLFHDILVMLKHNAREYVTAVTESNCAVVRQTMQRLLFDTLAEQADAYQVMGRQGWYPPSPVASRQDVQKSVQQRRQAAQELAAIGGHLGVRGNWQQGAGWQNQQPAGWQNQQPAGYQQQPASFVQGQPQSGWQMESGNRASRPGGYEGQDFRSRRGGEWVQ